MVIVGNTSYENEEVTKLLLLHLFSITIAITLTLSRGPHCQSEEQWTLDRIQYLPFALKPTE